jgi:hypothetical protein
LASVAGSVAISGWAGHAESAIERTHPTVEVRGMPERPVAVVVSTFSYSGIGPLRERVEGDSVADSMRRFEATGDGVAFYKRDFRVFG